MGRIDVGVFPNGGREVFGQVTSEPPVPPLALATEVSKHFDEMNVDKPCKFTGYYDAPDASDIEWAPYDENNPIVMVERTESPNELDDALSYYEPVELAQLPAEQREKYLSTRLCE